MATNVVSSCPPILENIFKYLNARDLSSCTRVCSTWRSLANSEKRKRKQISCVCVPQIAHDSENSKNDMERELVDQLESIQTSPTFAIAFSTTDFILWFEELCPMLAGTREPQKKKSRSIEHDRIKMKNVVGKALKPFLPLNCPIMLSAAPGVVGSNSKSDPFETENGPAMSIFLLPQVEGMKISHSYVDQKNCDMLKLLPEDVKCLLVFLTHRGIRLSNKIVRSTLDITKYKVAIGGAFVDRSEELLGSVIAFSGPNVEAASVVAPNTSNFLEKIGKFKDTGLLKHQCFAFMFVCVARGVKLYNKLNYESTAFQKMYPGVPLIGLFGNGEIGVTYLPNEDPCTDKKQYTHSYCTVFVLLAVKS